MPLSPFLLIAWLVAAAPATASGPTLAVEDTMRTEVPEVLVRAPRVTLDEILDRVARGEARRESLITDQSFAITLRVVGNVTGKKEPLRLEEISWRVMKKRPDKLRSVELRRYEYKVNSRGGANVHVDFTPSMGEEVVNFAFRPEGRRDYRFRIAGRDLVAGHLIYRIAFEPRSLLETEPEGTVWVDTNEMVIVREEMSFRQSPMPLFVRGLPRMVVERQRVDGHWVLKRILMRCELTIPFPKVGRAVDLAILYDDYHVNLGLEDAVFKPGIKP